MADIRFGIIGCGKVGHFHAQALQAIKGVRLVAACNHSKGKLDAFAAKYGIRSYLSPEEMVVKEHLDAVTIATPHPSHADLAVRCMRIGCHVIIEKPLAVTLEECDRIVETAKECHVLAGTLVQRRCYLPCRRIRKAIDEGRIGRPVLGEAVMLGWRSREYYQSDPWRGTLKGEGGGVLLTQASHQIDLLNWFMDSEVESVCGIAANFNHPYIEVEDSAAAVIRYKSGAMATLIASNSQNPALYGRVHVFGDNGASLGVKTDGGAMFIAGMSEIEEPPETDIWTVKGEEGRLEELKRQDDQEFAASSMITYHQKMLENFAKAIRGEERLIADAKAGREVIAICEAVYSGKPWHASATVQP
ncbi:MAG: Gfo/Idh/MocA family oxidoreductase [Aeromonadales bacterium]|nr:Gfo/Idh/MocA family oxidoreductase [Aeromonadales bacterium]MDY2891789.1 Gfo/Idh/MocA family oxidoreductase [Succinivibrio sp.]